MAGTVEHVCLRFIRDIRGVSDACRTTTYVWGGFVIDVMEGRLLREHGDLDCFTLDLETHLAAFMHGLESRGYRVRYDDGIGMLELRRDGFHACINGLGFDGGLAMWRHIGTEGTVFFPKDWLDSRPRPFHGTCVHTSGSLFEYAIKAYPELLSPVWKGRDSDRQALGYHADALRGSGVDTVRAMGMIRSHNPYWARKGYQGYEGLVGVPPAFPPVVGTIGHSNMPLDCFLGLLKEHGIGHVSDVRSVPASRYNPHFNGESLGRALKEAGIGYSYVGDLLGGRIQDPDCYRSGVVNIRKVNHAEQLDPDRVAVKPWFQRGLWRVLERAVHVPTAVMCSEEVPYGCHRHLLVARALTRLGIPVRHIRRKGPEEDAFLQRELW